MTWRASFEPIIRRTLAGVRGKSVKEIRKAIVDAYPLSERRYWPYKVWCDEVRRQRGLKVVSPRSNRDDAIKAGQSELPLFTEGTE